MADLGAAKSSVSFAGLVKVGARGPSDAEEMRQPSLDAVKGSSMSGEQNTSLYVWRAEYEFLCLESRIRVFMSGEQNTSFYVWRAEYDFGV